MKVILVSLAVALVLCNALEQPEEISVNDIDYGKDQMYNRYSRMHKGYHYEKGGSKSKKGSSSDKKGSSSEKKRSSSDKKGSSSDKKESSSDKKGSSSDKKRSSSDKKRSSSDKKGNGGGGEKEEAHEVFIQTLACPGKCLDTVPSPPGVISVVHEDCNNCNPNQKWRIKKYKGNQVQLEHVNSPGQCACIGEGTANAPQCNGFAIKLGPCTHESKYGYWSPSYEAHHHNSNGHGKPSELSLFEFTGGRFLSTYCLDQGDSSLISIFRENVDYCSPPPLDEPFAFAISNDGTVFVEEIFMVTSCLVDERKCSSGWW